MYVRIHRKSRHTERLGHDYTGCFVANTRQQFQSGHVCRYFAFMLFKQYFTETVYRFGFLRRQTAGSDDATDFLNR